jgi:hypothetical protein
LPIIDRRCQEMGVGLVQNTVTASGHLKTLYKVRKLELPVEVPKLELGNQRIYYFHQARFSLYSILYPFILLLAFGAVYRALPSRVRL